MTVCARVRVARELTFGERQWNEHDDDIASTTRTPNTTPISTDSDGDDDDEEDDDNDDADDMDTDTGDDNDDDDGDALIRMSLPDVPFPSSSGVQPLVTLVMIVRNEAHSLLATLLSTYGAVDRYALVDTGSTDNTRTIIRSFYAALPNANFGKLFREPFIDFSTTRNRALYLAGNETEFVLMLNGDDRLVNGAALRRFLESKRGLTAEDESIYIIPIDYGGISAGRSERIARTRNHFVANWPNDEWNHWRFEGVTHEAYLCNKALHNGAEIIYTDGSFSVYHDITYDTAERKRERFQLDIRLLLNELETSPQRINRPRSIYYLAQSYYNLGDYENAYVWYQKRVETNYPRPTPLGEDNEKARSYFLLANIAERRGLSADVIESFLKSSHSACPSAHALYLLAKHYHGVGDNTKAMNTAQRTSALLRKGSPVVCNGDDNLAAKQLPSLIAKIKQSAASSELRLR